MSAGSANLGNRFLVIDALHLPLFDESDLERKFGDEYAEYKKNRSLGYHTTKHGEGRQLFSFLLNPPCQRGRARIGSIAQEYDLDVLTRQGTPKVSSLSNLYRHCALIIEPIFSFSDSAGPRNRLSS